MAKPPKPFRPVVATANDLRTGAVVFRGRDGRWTREFAAAETAEDPEAAAALLARARADHDACVVVEPALIEIVREDGFRRPAALKERIRAAGPTVAPPA